MLKEPKRIIAEEPSDADEIRNIETDGVPEKTIYYADQYQQLSGQFGC